MQFQVARLRSMNVRPIHSLVTERVANAENDPAVDSEPLTKEVVA